MTALTARYAPGEGVALVGPGAAVLADLAGDADLVARLWPHVEAELPFGELVRALLPDLLALPSLVIVGRHGDRWAVLVRGAARCVVSAVAPSVDVEVVAEGLVTWREQPLPGDVDALVLTLSAASSPAGSWPMDAGVVLAHRLDLRIGTAPARVGAVEFAVPESRVETVSWPPTSALPEQTLPPDDLPATQVPLVEAPPVAQDGTASAAGAVEVRPPDEPVSESPSSPGSPESETNRYDYMWDELTRRPATDDPELAALVALAQDPPDVPAEPPASESPQARADEDAPPAPPAGPSPPPVPAAPVAAAALPGLIDAVPWSTAASHRPAPAGPPSSPALPAIERMGRPAPVDDVAEHTIKRGDQQRLVQQMLAGADALAPQVLALLCPSDHPNDPQHQRCRRCGQSLPEAALVPVPRPVLGQLQLSSGDLVPLDRPVLLGRNPKADLAADERPHLVKVGGPTSDVSRSHVMVHLDGWHVLVEDLASTNGTEIELPGAAPQRLRTGEAVLIEPGTRVLLAGDVSFRYEVRA